MTEEAAIVRTPLYYTLLPLLLGLLKPLFSEHTEFLDQRILAIKQQICVVAPYCPFDQFLRKNVSDVPVDTESLDVRSW